MGTVILAAVCVFLGGVLLPPIARTVGGLLAILGLLGLFQARTWALTVFLVGAGFWLVGHWSFAARNDAHFRSRIALALFEVPPLQWTLPQWHAKRRRNRCTAGRATHR